VLTSHADRLLFDLLVVESDAVGAATAPRTKERQPETVNLNSFYRFHDCGRLIETRNARYPMGRFRRGTPPNCTSCYGKIMAGAPIREEDTSLFADMVGSGRGAAAPNEGPDVEPMGLPYTVAGQDHIGRSLRAYLPYSYDKSWRTARRHYDRRISGLRSNLVNRGSHAGLEQSSDR
jgi:hypothetical protein